MKLPKYVFADKDRSGARRLRMRVKQHGRTKTVTLKAPLGSADFDKEYADALDTLKGPTGPSGERGYVYFATYGKHRIKIGTSTNVRTRLMTIQTNLPGKVHVVYVTPGSRTLEAKLHKQFAQYRLNGEWFIFGREIRDWIESDRHRRIVEADAVGNQNSESECPSPLSNSLKLLQGGRSGGATTLLRNQGVGHSRPPK